MAAQPKEILEKLLTLLGFEAKVAEQQDDGHIMLDIQTDDPGRLIGRQGQTLAELQYLTNRIIFRDDQNAPKVTLDVGGYRSQARDALIKKAQEAAEKVRKWGDIVEMEPLNAFDRRIVHNALKDDPDIETQSVEVEGTDRKVILLRPRRN
ncbi:MAG TPA: R3H domain-containing nucleic acid-binding protein [Methylomirabilota bacterium]|nr:R3H domain-containing nucleic acid-binding protein [Methylomirabilota bacterium]